MPELSEWYHVSFDDRAVYRQVEPPGQEAWSDEFSWDSIVRVCFKTAGLYESDEVYIFTRGREASYQIPTEADGGAELLGEIIERKLFPAETLIGMMGTEDELRCWPGE